MKIREVPAIYFAARCHILLVFNLFYLAVSVKNIWYMYWVQPKILFLLINLYPAATKPKKITRCEFIT